jgi:GT2 family glycosyltransferase
MSYLVANGSSCWGQGSSEKVSIIIPSFNSEPLIQGCLESILATNYSDFEVILVDDGSNDNSVGMAMKLFGSDPHLKVVRNARNLGPAASRNTGISVAKGEYLAFVETDMRVEPNWLNESMKILNSDPSIGGTVIKVLDINNPSYIHSVGVTIIPQTGWVICRGLGQADNGAFDSVADVCAGAVGLLLKREIVDRIGPFDEQLVHNIDDVDFGWRIWLAGFRISSAPLSVVYHWSFKPGEVRQIATPSLLSEFHSSKMVRVFLKNYEWRNVMKYLPWLVAITLLRISINLARNNSVPALGLLMSIPWNFNTLGSTLKERHRIQDLVRQVPDKYIFEKIMLADPALKSYRNYLASLRFVQDNKSRRAWFH